MLDEKELARLNELAKKKKTESLTAAETAEQKILREKYLKNFRRNISGQIEKIKVVDTEGNDLTSEKIKRIQKEKGIHNRDQEI